ncbi:MAG: glutamate-5-semialdehyde dehydrogenase [Pseudomonadota bacterium]
MNQAAHSKQNNNLILQLGYEAKEAASNLAQCETETINTALESLADAIQAKENTILKANQLDVSAAKDKELSHALIDRLTLNSERLKAIAQSVHDIAALPDPVGKTLSETQRPNGLIIKKVSVPIGVLGMIYESRPNVTIDAAALCLKSHNAVILRGGSESFHSSKALHDLVQTTLERHNILKSAVQMVPSTDRTHVGEMLAAHDVIDVMIPRGGKGLTSKVMNEAKMPVFAHLDGNCHIYIDEAADVETAKNVLLNAKFRRTGICGAAESLLVHDTQKERLMGILQPLVDQNCTFVGDETAQSLSDLIGPATQEDWVTEYLDAKLSIKFVQNTDEAIEHINRYGSHHTECIITEDEQNAQSFLNRVDSAIVMHNSSTQFADGGEFGMGAEIGIGTGKLHARGPVGLEQLTTFKYHVLGNGQVRP